MSSTKRVRILGVFRQRAQHPQLHLTRLRPHTLELPARCHSASDTASAAAITANRWYWRRRLVALPTSAGHRAAPHEGRHADSPHVRCHAGSRRRPSRTTRLVRTPQRCRRLAAKRCEETVTGHPNEGALAATPTSRRTCRHARALRVLAPPSTYPLDACEQLRCRLDGSPAAPRSADMRHRLRRERAAASV
jgi:hypothetical protein